MGLQKSEFKYIVVATVFSMIWFFLVLPKLLGNGASDWSPYNQFLIFNLGIYFLYFFMFKSWALGTKSSLKLAVMMILPVIASSLITPGYFIDFNNGSLIESQMSKASTDYVVGYFWQGLGFSGKIIVYLVYGLSFFLLLLLASLINGNLVKKI